MARESSAAQGHCPLHPLDTYLLGLAKDQMGPAVPVSASTSNLPSRLTQHLKDSPANPVNLGDITPSPEQPEKLALDLRNAQACRAILAYVKDNPLDLEAEGFEAMLMLGGWFDGSCVSVVPLLADFFKDYVKGTIITKTFADINTWDCLFAGTLTRFGCMSTWGAMSDRAHQALEADGISPNARIMIVGHSQGGILGNFLGSDLGRNHERDRKHIEEARVLSPREKDTYARLVEMQPARMSEFFQAETGQRMSHAMSREEIHGMQNEGNVVVTLDSAMHGGSQFGRGSEGNAEWLGEIPSCVFNWASAALSACIPPSPWGNDLSDMSGHAPLHAMLSGEAAGHLALKLNLGDAQSSIAGPKVSVSSSSGPKTRGHLIEPLGQPVVSGCFPPFAAALAEAEIPLVSNVARHVAFPFYLATHAAFFCEVHPDLRNSVKIIGQVPLKTPHDHQ